MAILLNYNAFFSIDFFFLCSDEWLNICVSLNLGVLAWATVINHCNAQSPKCFFFLPQWVFKFPIRNHWGKKLASILAISEGYMNNNIIF